MGVVRMDQPSGGDGWEGTPPPGCPVNRGYLGDIHIGSSAPASRWCSTLALHAL